MKQFAPTIQATTRPTIIRNHYLLLPFVLSNTLPKLVIGYTPLFFSSSSNYSASFCRSIVLSILLCGRRKAATTATGSCFNHHISFAYNNRHNNCINRRYHSAAVINQSCQKNVYTLAQVQHPITLSNTMKPNNGYTNNYDGGSTTNEIECGISSNVQQQVRRSKRKLDQRLDSTIRINPSSTADYIESLPMSIPISPTVTARQQETRKRKVKSKTNTNKGLKSTESDPILSLGPTTIVSSSSINVSTIQAARIVTPDPVVSIKYDPEIIPSSSIGTKRVLSYDDPNDNEGYIDLCIPPAELRPSKSLTTGQCFHWKAIDNNNNDDNNADNEPSSSTTTGSNKKINPSQQQSAWGIHNAKEWVGILRVSYPKPEYKEKKQQQNNNNNNDDEESDMSISTIVISVRETPSTTLYKTLYAPDHVNVTEHLLSYFHIRNSHNQIIQPTLSELYMEWSSQCSRLQQIAVCIPGVRVLNQDPWECFVSFLCSSNNNIPRITKMLQLIREQYGTPLLVIDSHGTTQTYYSFPSLNRLMKLATERDLRDKCGMGYRARYLIESMQLLKSLGGESYLHTIKNSVTDPTDVQEALLQFTGIGRKVADCIALFSLNQHDAIPVDVHVWNIARRDYDPSLLRNTTSVTPTVYHRVGDVFRKRFPTKSGWAHSLLFVAELPSFRSILPERLIQDMDRFKEAEKRRKNK